MALLAEGGFLGSSFGGRGGYLDGSFGGTGRYLDGRCGGNEEVWIAIVERGYIQRTVCPGGQGFWTAATLHGSLAEWANIWMAVLARGVHLDGSLRGRAGDSDGSHLAWQFGGVGKYLDGGSGEWGDICWAVLA
jgi:hypothetical protein